MLGNIVHNEELQEELHTYKFEEQLLLRELINRIELILSKSSLIRVYPTRIEFQLKFQLIKMSSSRVFR